MNRTKIIITIDTESYAQGMVPIEADIYGEIGRERYGVEKIMDLCDAHNFKATFFVDVLEHHLFGKTALSRLCRCISDRCHDVELHSHPNLIPGNPFRFMCHYDLATQKDIIREGKELIGEWTGKSPVAFRAGSYGANLATIRALAETGFKLDSSYFTFHRNCELSRELNNRYKNMVFDIEGVTEIPVTVYKLLDTFLYEDYSKIDINACAREEICYIIGQLAGKVEVLILFLHSFSFLQWNGKMKRFIPDGYCLEKFDYILKAIAQRSDVRVVTMEEYCRDAAPVSAVTRKFADYIPRSNLLLNVNRIMSRYIRQ